MLEGEEDHAPVARCACKAKGAAPVNVPEAVGFQAGEGGGDGGPKVAQQPCDAVPWDLPDAKEAQDMVYPIRMEVPAQGARL